MIIIINKYRISTLHTALSLEEIKNKLSQFGMKATHQRIVVYNALQQMHIHPSAEEVYTLIHTANPSISLATVYNTLDSFVDVKLITKVSSQEGKGRYDFNTNNHHHIYVTNTDEIIDYHDPELLSMIEEYLKNKNITNLSIEELQLHIKAKKINPEKGVGIH